MFMEWTKFTNPRSQFPIYTSIAKIDTIVGFEDKNI